jgi:hypothetical protein
MADFEVVEVDLDEFEALEACLQSVEKVRLITLGQGSGTSSSHAVHAVQCHMQCSGTAIMQPHNSRAAAALRQVSRAALHHVQVGRVLCVGSDQDVPSMT